MNLKSKRVVLTIPLLPNDIALDAILDNVSFTVLYSNKLCKYNLDSEIIFEYDFENEIVDGKILVKEGLIFIQDQINSVLTIISKNDNINSDNESAFYSRRFEISKFTIDPSCKVLVGIKDKEILIFDILSGNLLETIITNKQLVDVAILDNFKFLSVLDMDSHIHLLSNCSHFNSVMNRLVFGMTASTLKIPIIKKETNFYKDLMIYKSSNVENDHELIIKGLSQDETKSLLKLISENMKTDFFNSQKLLNKVLLYKNSMISSEDIEIINVSVNEKLKEIEDDVLRGLSSL